jgi:cell division septation protein DedD
MEYREKSYYEIQLDHKQLIVVFFAVVAICVVMFLLGVMVGKGKAVAALEVPGAHGKAQAKMMEDAKPAKEKVSPASGAESSKKTGAEPEKGTTRVAESTKQKESAKPAPVKEKVSTPVPAAKKPVKAVSPASDVASLKVSDLPLDMVNGYAIHVRSYPSRDKAQAMRSRLKAAGYPAYVDPGKLRNKGRSYRVRVGKFVNEADARKVLEKLKTKDKYTQLWIVPK